MTKCLKPFLFLILFIFIFSACQSETAETVPDYDNNSDLCDFDGKEISFMSESSLFFGYAESSPSYDALLNRIKEVEKKYDCKITYENNSVLQTLVSSSVAAGVSLCHALYLDALPFRQLASGGYLLDLISYSNYIDVNDSFRWGSKNVLELCAYGGHLYGVTPAAWVDKLAPYYFMLITNNNIIQRNEFAHPHEYYENKTWNRTVFEEMVSKCADEEKGIYGLDTSNEYVGRMAVYSDGIGLVDYSTGTPRSAWHGDIVVEDLQWAADFISRNGKYITQGGETYDVFIQGNSAMALSAVWHFCRKIIFSTALNGYSVMPFPCSDSVEPGTCGGFFSTGLDTISMPSNNTDEAETAMVINDIFSPMDGCETQELLDSYYLSNIFFSETDIEIFKECMQNARYNYHVEEVFQPIGNIITNVLNGHYSPSQSIEKYIEIADKYIVEIVVPNEEGMKNYFSD